MKYLKRYENLEKPQPYDSILKWLKFNKLNRVFFEPNGLEKNDEKILGISVDNDNVITCHWKYIDDEVIWRNGLRIFTDDCKKMILDYLKSFSPGEIEQLQIEQETEKFNM